MGRLAQTVLPAYAGMIRHPRHSGRAASCAPRVCGDDPQTAGVLRKNSGVLPAYAGMIQPRRRVWTIPDACSPRMRG